MWCAVTREPYERGFKKNLRLTGQMVKITYIHQNRPRGSCTDTAHSVQREARTLELHLRYRNDVSLA